MGLLNIYSEKCKKDFFATIRNVSEKASIDSLQVYDVVQFFFWKNSD